MIFHLQEQFSTKDILVKNGNFHVKIMKSREREDNNERVQTKVMRKITNFRKFRIRLNSFISFEKL